MVPLLSADEVIWHRGSIEASTAVANPRYYLAAVLNMIPVLPEEPKWGFVTVK